jgi:hypothetical protein
MIIRASVIAVSAALMAPLGAGVAASWTPMVAVADEKTAEGTIKSVDSTKNEFVLSVGVGNDKKDVTIKVNATTKYTLDGKDSTMADALKAGNMAKATHTDNVATKVDARTPRKPG